MTLGDKLGEGSSRTVYRYSNHKVIKMAKNMAGRRQNETEVNITPSDITPFIYKHAPDFEWIVVDELRPITKEYLNDALGVPAEAFYNYACDIIRPRFASDVDMMIKFFIPCQTEVTNAMANIIRNSKLAQNIIQHAIRNNSPIGELCRFDSWGTTRGKLKLRDYGLTYDIYNNCYTILDKEYSVTKPGHVYTYNKGCILPNETYEELLRTHDDRFTIRRNLDETIQVGY